MSSQACQSKLEQNHSTPNKTMQTQSLQKTDPIQKKFNLRTWWRCPAWDSFPRYRGPGLAAHKLCKCFNIILVVIFSVTCFFSTELLLSLCHLNHRVFQKSGFLPERSQHIVTQDGTFLVATYWYSLLGLEEPPPGSKDA